ncbi:thiol:disulfide interchange protein DsbC [Massilia terrae]|uniref:Thiol:disulfide interchange protein n=1 Tax=Massilia terrae TaxID=1811224 RepID=A0ABT2D245_9BURK|nr:DsbC family protein [Massilia terrae]MCS0660298.1 DsbC family protein [Massilia terrae]
MEWKKAALVLAAALASAQLQAETPDEARIKQVVEPRMGKNVKVDAVTKTPYGGLYEVRTGGDIFYTDETARYMFVGKVVDLTTLKDLTRERMDTLAGIPSFNDLPLNLAIKTVKGNGSRVMAVFEDPNCPYCKKLHATMKNVDNVTVYTFLLNILSDDSTVKGRDIWCAADRSKAWEQWMDEGKAAPAANCATPNDQVIALARKLHVMGTPTVYFYDGTRTITGFDVATLNARLDASKPKS